MATYGYARISTDGRSLDAQVKQLRVAAAEKVFRETASGAQTNRAFLNTLATIAAKGAGFRSLHYTWADTTTPHRRLMRS
jgi:DNA invertase Pin-like site-specific DNA recombinase